MKDRTIKLLADSEVLLPSYPQVFEENSSIMRIEHKGQIEVELKRIDDCLSGEKCEVIVQFIGEMCAMAADILSVKVLYMQGSSVLLHLEVDALCLMLVAEEPAPGLLNSNSCTCSTKKAFNIKDERLLVVL